MWRSHSTVLTIRVHFGRSNAFQLKSLFEWYFWVCSVQHSLQVSTFAFRWWRRGLRKNWPNSPQAISDSNRFFVSMPLNVHLFGLDLFYGEDSKKNDFEINERQPMRSGKSFFSIRMRRDWFGNYSNSAPKTISRMQRLNSSCNDRKIGRPKLMFFPFRVVQLLAFSFLLYCFSF